MKFPYGKVIRTDEIGTNQLTLEVLFRSNQTEELAAFRRDVYNFKTVRWKRVRRWTPIEGSFEFCDNYVTAIATFERTP